MTNIAEEALSSTQRIKIQLVMREMTQADLARKINGHPREVSAVIMGSRRTFWIRLAIATEFNIPVRELWPDEGNQRTLKRQPKS